jgi:hypothetical protein
MRALVIGADPTAPIQQRRSNSADPTAATKRTKVMALTQQHHLVDVAGLVARPGTVDLATFVSSHRRDALLVAPVDVLADAHLDTAADVIVAVDAAGGSVAVPVRDVLFGGSWLVLTRHGRVGLFVPGWSDAGLGFPTVSLVAMTFVGFLALPTSIDAADPS